MGGEGGGKEKDNYFSEGADGKSRAACVRFLPAVVAASILNDRRKKQPQSSPRLREATSFLWATTLSLSSLSSENLLKSSNCQGRRVVNLVSTSFVYPSLLSLPFVIAAAAATPFSLLLLLPLSLYPSCRSVNTNEFGDVRAASSLPSREGFPISTSCVLEVKGLRKFCTYEVAL